MNEGNRRKKKLWSAQGRAQLEKLSLWPRKELARQDGWSCWPYSDIQPSQR